MPSHARQRLSRHSLPAEHGSAPPAIYLRLWERRKLRRWRCAKSRRSSPSPTLPLPAAKAGSVVPSHARQRLSRHSLPAEHGSALPAIYLRLWERRKPRRWQCAKSSESYPSPTLPLPAAKGGNVVPSHARQRLSRRSLPAEHGSALPDIYLRLWERRKPRRWQCVKGRRSSPSPALPLPAAKAGSVVPSHARQRLYLRSSCRAWLGTTGHLSAFVGTA